MSEFQKQLAKVKADYAKARKAVEENPGGAGDFPKLDPGQYEGRVTDGEVNTSKSSGRLQCFIELTPTEGDSKGTSCRKYYGIPSGLEFLIRDFARLGIEAPEDPEEIEDALKKLVKAKPLVKFRVKENGEYLNVYIDKVLDAGETGGGEDTSATRTNGKKEEPTGGEGEVAIEVGLEVLADGDEGVVSKIDEDAGEITVILDGSKKKVIVGVDQLQPRPAKEKKKGLSISRK